jgi:hypothetical protein
MNANPTNAQAPVLLIARFRGDVEELTRAYDRAHQVIMDAGGPPGELRHHCAVSADSLYIIGLWESEESLRTRFASDEMRGALERTGFPAMSEAEQTILQVHQIEPPIP